MENVIGRTIEIRVEDEFIPFTVTAVADDIPSNSSVRFDAIGNFNFMETIGNARRGVNNWMRSSYITFVQLKEGSGLANDRKKLVDSKQTTRNVNGKRYESRKQLSDRL